MSGIFTEGLTSIQLDSLKHQVCQADGSLYVRSKCSFFKLPDDGVLINNDQFHIFFITFENSCFAIGNNMDGALGVGFGDSWRSVGYSDSWNVSDWTPVVGLKGKACYAEDVFFLSTAGELFVTGDNAFGCNPQSKSPIKVPGLEDIRCLSAGGAVALALDGSGRVFSDVKPRAVSAGRPLTINPPSGFCGETLVSNGFAQVVLTKEKDGSALPPIKQIATCNTVAYMLSFDGDVYYFGHEKNGLPEKLVLDSGDRVKALTSDGRSIYLLTESGSVLTGRVSVLDKKLYISVLYDGKAKHIVAIHKYDRHKFKVVTAEDNMSYIRGSYHYPDGSVRTFSDWTRLSEAGLTNVFEFIRKASELLMAANLPEFEDYLKTIPKRFMPVLRDEEALKPFFAYIDGLIRLGDPGIERAKGYQLWLDGIPLDSVYAKVVAPILLCVLYGEYIALSNNLERHEIMNLIGKYATIASDYSLQLKMLYPRHAMHLTSAIDSMEKLTVASAFLAGREVGSFKSLTECEEFKSLEDEGKTNATVVSSMTAESAAELVFWKAVEAPRIPRGGAGAGAGAGAGSEM